LVVLDGDLQVLALEPGNRDGNAQDLVAAIGQSLDIVRRITIAGGFDCPLEQAFQIVKPQQKGRGKHGYLAHRTFALAKAASRMLRPIWHRSLIANMRVPEADFKEMSWQGFWIVWRW
jgi:hypothetical protein